MRPTEPSEAIRASDAEITRPHNDLLDMDAPPLPWPAPPPLPEDIAHGYASAFTSPITPQPRGVASSRRRTVPPIANPIAVPLVKVRRPPELLPPPPPIEPRLEAPYEESGPVARAQLATTEQSPSPFRLGSSSGIQELRPLLPPSVPPPPIALDARARPARGSSSKALWLGAAALVALSASNGALVSALLWSMRHDSPPPSGRTAVAPSASARESCPTTNTERAANDGAASERATRPGSDSEHPLSIEQLPLAGSKASSANDDRESARSSSAPVRGRLASVSSTAHVPGRKGTRRSSALSEEALVSPRESARAEPSVQGPPDRQAIAQAVGRAAAAASACSSGRESGRVSITFNSSGNVAGVQLLSPFSDTGVNSCVLRAMGRAHVRAFSGDSITVQKTVKW